MNRDSILTLVAGTLVLISVLACGRTSPEPVIGVDESQRFDAICSLWTGETSKLIAVTFLEAEMNPIQRWLAPARDADPKEDEPEGDPRVVAAA